METTFKNKVIIITGSTYGIGKSAAIAFAQRRGAKKLFFRLEAGRRHSRRHQREWR